MKVLALNDTMEVIVRFLEVSDIGRLSATCRSIHDIIKQFDKMVIKKGKMIIIRKNILFFYRNLTPTVTLKNKVRLNLDETWKMG